MSRGHLGYKGSRRLDRYHCYTKADKVVRLLSGGRLRGIDADIFDFIHGTAALVDPALLHHLCYIAAYIK